MWLRIHILAVILHFTLLSGNVDFCAGQIPTASKCLEKTPLTPIDIRKLSGQWYEVEASTLLSEWPYKCISVKVASYFERKTQVTVEGIQRSTNKSQVLATVSTVIPISSDGKDGKLEITTAAVNVSTDTDNYRFQINYKNLTTQVLATDHVNWVVVRLCKDLSHNAHTELIWVLSRQRELSSKDYQSVREAVTSLNLETLKTRETIQTGCTNEQQAKPSISLRQKEEY